MLELRSIVAITAHMCSIVRNVGIFVSRYLKLKKNEWKKTLSIFVATSLDRTRFRLRVG